MLTKTPRDSFVEMTQMVLPSDTNALGTIFGGKIMSWVDIAGAIAAQRHARRNVVTVSMDQLHFRNPVKLGYTVRIRAQVAFVARTSMEVVVEIHAENPLSGEVTHTASASLTFVALDDHGRPTTVPGLIPETEEEKAAHEKAVSRRNRRLFEARKQAEK
jgi:acyl-CoA hydrolase